jgi:hypothetical protein
MNAQTIGSILFGFIMSVLYWLPYLTKVRELIVVPIVLSCILLVVLFIRCLMAWKENPIVATPLTIFYSVASVICTNVVIYGIFCDGGYIGLLIPFAVVITMVQVARAIICDDCL